MNQRVAEAIQALRDKADWLENLPESKQEELGWEVATRSSIGFWASSEEDAWKKRALISGPGVTKEVTTDHTVWTRKVTDRFTLTLTLPRSSTCQPVYETEWVTEEVDGVATWNEETGKYQLIRKVQKRVGWDCGPSDTP